MAPEILPDDLWNIVEPLIPNKPRRTRFPGRKRIDDRTVLQGILFVLKTGMPWEYFPKEMGCSGMTLWRRLREWMVSGIWQKILESIIAKLNAAGNIDLSRVIIDSSSVRAVFGG